MSTPFRLLLPRQFHTRMLAQAKAEFPNECCGLLAGSPDKRMVPVEQMYPLNNALASPTEYESEPMGMFQAVRDMRDKGIEVVAVYHSHPASPAVPSMKDRDRSYGPEVVNLIISLRSPEPEIRGWWLSAEDQQEAEWELID